MYEPGLSWEEMPSKTCLMKEEAKASGFRVMMNCITLVMLQLSIANQRLFKCLPTLEIKIKTQLETLDFEDIN